MLRKGIVCFCLGGLEHFGQKQFMPGKVYFTYTSKSWLREAGAGIQAGAQRQELKDHNGRILPIDLLSSLLGCLC